MIGPYAHSTKRCRNIATAVLIPLRYALTSSPNSSSTMVAGRHTPTSPVNFEDVMEGLGWNTILQGWPWFAGTGHYPISAYSEFMPPPLLGRSPYGSLDPLFFQKEDPWGWPVTEYEEGFELSPGLAMIAQSLLAKMLHLGLTAAHRSLPFGTCLVVENPRTGKSVRVTVNDRGPFTPGMALDIKSGAARAIGMRSSQAITMRRC
jgi:hypothetical protein